MSLPLNDIITAITNEIKTAEVRADMNQAYWRSVYDDNELLNELHPSPVKVREVKVSLPLAMDKTSEAEIVKPTVTAYQLEKILPADISKTDKRSYSVALEKHLITKDRNLLSRTLESEIANGLKTITPDDISKKVDLSIIRKLKHDYLVQPKEDRQAHFIYTSKDLQTLASDQIIRLDFTIDIG
jgi:hypothetical protein